MGLLDCLENQGLSSLLSGNTSSLASGLLQMIQNQPGGLSGLMQSFQEKGLGGLATSWVSTGQNLPVSGEQIHDVLGSDMVKSLAAKAGISPDMASGAIASLLPSIVDKLTPNGQVPEHNNVMDMLGGLLQNLGKAS